MQKFKNMFDGIMYKQSFYVLQVNSNIEVLSDNQKMIENSV